MLTFFIIFASMIRKIVIASDSFKGSLTSAQVAEAAGQGIRDVLPECDIASVAVADGGEGTLDAISGRMAAEPAEAMVHDPLGRKINASYGICMHTGRQTAIIESAAASGLTLLTPEERNPLYTSSYGSGELIRHAYERGCRKFIIGLGGSATNDGGTGMLEALGVRFIDTDGKEITGCCGSKLSAIRSIDTSGLCIDIDECEFIAACDVDTPFVGPDGASNIFARQKGADDKAIAELENGMKSFAGIIKMDSGCDLSIVPGSGAAGGLGGALHAFMKARLEKGIDLILDTVGFENLISDADLIITGEGRIDSQTAKGKAAAGVLKRAGRTPVVAIAGQVSLAQDEKDELGFRSIIQISPTPKDEAGLKEVMNPETASGNIRKAVSRYISSLLDES